MMVHVPSVRHTVPNFRPIHGLGQEDGSFDYTTPTPIDTSVTPIDTSVVSFPTVPTTALPNLPPISTINPSTGYASDLSAAEIAFLQGGAAPSAGSTTTGAQTAAQILAAAAQAAGAGSAILKSTQSPGLIAGTSLVYNPATGQILSATGGTPAAAVTSSLTSMLPILLIGGIALVFLSGKH